MKRSKKWTIAGVCVVAIVSAGVLSFEPIVNKIGESELHALAIDTHYCRTESCSEGIEAVTNELVQQSGLTADKVPWCIATNKIYNSDYASLNGLKNKFVDWMYQRCERGELTLDDANITLEPPHSHDHDDDNGHSVNDGHDHSHDSTPEKPNGPYRFAVPDTANEPSHEQ